jgi:biotin synthase
MQVLSDVLDRMVASALERKPIDRSDALSVLGSDDDELLHVVAAASVVRRRFFQNRVKLNFLVNMKSGLCPEDCSYCSQRKGSSAEVLRYTWIDAATASDAAERAVAAGAARICLVASGRGPSERDIERIIRTVKKIKERRPKLEICVSLGLLADGQAQRLLDAGVFAYNHNLNTSSSRYAQICSTHTYEDRRTTVEMAQKGGLSPCSGAIFGMGESDEEVVDLAYALRALDPDSVPVNFLMPFRGTPLHGQWELTPARCLRILSVYRFCFPAAELRIAGGRELHLRSLQPLALHVANSIFLGDYLTSEGQPGEEDLAMLEDGGFVIEGGDDGPLPRPNRRHEVALRRRGPGTEKPADPLRTQGG